MNPMNSIRKSARFVLVWGVLCAALGLACGGEANRSSERTPAPETNRPAVALKAKIVYYALPG